MMNEWKDGGWKDVLLTISGTILLISISSNAWFIVRDRNYLDKRLDDISSNINVVASEYKRGQQRDLVLLSYLRQNIKFMYQPYNKRIENMKNLQLEQQLDQEIKCLINELRSKD